MSAACPIFGFDATLTPVAGTEPAVQAALRADFVRLALEPLGLVAESGPPTGASWRHTITRDGGQATDADRQAVAAWAAGRPAIASCEIGPLVDLSRSA